MLHWKPAASLLLILLSPGKLAANIEPVRDSIQKALGGLSSVPNASLLSVTMADGVATLDFSPETGVGMTEEALESLTEAVFAAFPEKQNVSEWVFTCNGRLLSSYLPPVPEIYSQEHSLGSNAPSAGALSGKTIAISPGHGWTSNTTGTGWGLQRGYWQGIVEDFENPEIVQYLFNLLVNNGATVYPTREMDKTYGQCSTVYTFAGLTRTAPNKPWWQMAALYHAVRQSAPSSVYDNGRTSDGNRDIAARPLYANWRGADIMVSLHNNGYDGTATGTLTMYETGNGYRVTDAANQYGSQYLAEKIHSQVISEIKANYNSSWYSYGAKGYAGNYGENNYFKGPACIVEAAFMDTPTPDNAALQDENFKMLVAKAIYKGICDYFHVTPTWNTNVAAPSGSWTASPWTKTWSAVLGSPVNAAPSSSGGWVYAATDAGIVYGVPATTASGFPVGVVKWKYPTSGNLGAAVKARPTVYNDTVYAVTLAGKLVALNRSTGALLWTATVPTSGNLICPPAATPAGTLIIGSDNGKLYSYSQATGALLKTFPTTFGAINAQVAIPDNGHVWVSSADGAVRCLSGDLSTVLWQRSTGAAVNSAPYVSTTNNSVYVSNAANKVVALNASNGSTAAGWPASGASVGYNIGTSPWADGVAGIVSFGTDNHAIYALYTANGSVPGEFPLRPFGVKEFTSTPVVLNGVTYIGGTDGRFYALRRTNGSVNPGTNWRTFTTESEGLTGQFRAAPTLTGTGTGDLVVAGCTNGRLYAFPL